MGRTPVRFITTREFRKAADGVFGPAHLENIKVKLALNPVLGDLILGTGGVRKLRQFGLRGQARVIYYFHLGDSEIFLLTCYAKNEKGDLTHREKAELRAAVDSIRIAKRR